ncbi:MAG: vWA domain-containing protein [Acidimicrobiales bacterium]
MLMNKRRTGMALVLTALSIAGCSFGTSEDEAADVDTATTTANEQDSDAESAQGPDDAEESDDQAQETDEPEEPQGALLLIMDASGSMNEVDASGQPLIDGAKRALHGVVDSLPDDVNVGLRVYGHRYPNTDRANGCQDTELIAPVAPLDRAGLNEAIDGYQAMGFTPIGLSLQQAVDDLPPEGPRSILLVSDGEDTCAPPDPCQVAEDVRAEGVELVIHTVGFALPDDASRQQLQCIAEAGGGEFYDAADATELADTLEDVSTRETRRYETSGIALEGAPIPRDADTGETDTAYVDTALGGEVNFYRFEIEPGSEVQGEVILTGNAGNQTNPVCPNVYLTDQGDEDYANAPFPGGAPDETFVKNTEPVVIDADEVWIKVAITHCASADVSESDEFDVELQLTVLD